VRKAHDENQSGDDFNYNLGELQERTLAIKQPAISNQQLPQTSFLEYLLY